MVIIAYDIKVHFKYNSLLGCPSIIRSDYGTENSVLAACHMALRHNHDDEFSGFDLGLPQQTQLSSYVRTHTVHKSCRIYRG